MILRLAFLINYELLVPGVSSLAYFTYSQLVDTQSTAAIVSQRVVCEVLKLQKRFVLVALS